MTMFIHFFCLCPLSLVMKLNFNISKVVYCRDKHPCRLGGDCLIQNVVYQATVESPMGSEKYIGLTANQFKTRFPNHTASFRNENKRNTTELSKHIWSLKDAKTEFTVTWNGSRQAVFKCNKEMQSLHNRKIFHHM